MKLEWDPYKNRTNVRKHGLDFADVEEVFRGVLVVNADTREDYGERRWMGLGTIGGRTVHVVFAELGPDSIRIISLRKATSREHKAYETAIQDGLETH